MLRSIAQPLHELTRKNSDFVWSEKCKSAFGELKSRLASPPILAYPSFDRDFVLETDASIQGLGAVLSQVQADGKLHPIAYASRGLSVSEKNYGITELETLAVVWAISHFHYYLYGHRVVVYTDHTAVRAILETPSPSGKHARWWNKVYASGVKSIQIVYRAGKDNVRADALSRGSQEPRSTTRGSEESIRVSVVTTLTAPALENIPSLLRSSAEERISSPDFSTEQRKDEEVRRIATYLEEGLLSDDPQQARKTAAEAMSFCLFDKILYYIDPSQQI